jgi:hypothetical protein
MTIASQLPDPPSPVRSIRQDDAVLQYYMSYQDAMMAAAFSRGYLTDAEPDDGAWVVRWDLR